MMHTTIFLDTVQEDDACFAAQTSVVGYCAWMFGQSPASEEAGSVAVKVEAHRLHFSWAEAIVSHRPGEICSHRARNQSGNL